MRKSKIRYFFIPCFVSKSMTRSNMVFLEHFLNNRYLSSCTCSRSHLLLEQQYSVSSASLEVFKRWPQLKGKANPSTMTKKIIALSLAVLYCSAICGNNNLSLSFKISYTSVWVLGAENFYVHNLSAQKVPESWCSKIKLLDLISIRRIQIFWISQSPILVLFFSQRKRFIFAIADEGLFLNEKNC